MSPERPSPQGLLPRELETLFRVVRSYPWAVTPYYLSLSRVQDPHDPIRRQFLPEAEELDVRGNGSLDPLDEKSHEPVPGLIRRYPDRAVLLVTGRCAVFCRHCFRKRLWRQRRAGREVAGLEAASLSPALDFLRATTEVREVILSGGDPLILPDESLDRILDRIRRVPHVEIVRIGTRLPVVLPQRITPGLCQVLERHATVWVVTQFNHPREITPESAAACERLLRAGVPVVNQTVLLRGVNDDLEIMTSLCQGLLRIRVKPYYLHQCDRVAGAEHFRTPLERGVEIIRGIQGRVSGLALPKFVVDLPGKAGKVPLHPGQLVRGEDGRFILRGNNGETFFYENPRPEACPAL